MPVAWLSASLALLSFTTQGQPPEPPETEIVVEAIRPTPGQIEGFVDALATEPGRAQLSRFDLPVCPLALGLQPSQNQQIAERMRRVAAAVGIAVAPAGCAPNVLVVVTRDKKPVIEQLRREQPEYFTDVPLAERRRLIDEPGPASAWQVEGLRTREGDIVQRDDRGVYTTLSDQHRGASRIALPSHPHFLFAAVVVEMEAIAGLSTTQLADYAAMRTFARIDPRRMRGSSVPSIVRALDTAVGSPIPLTLTQWDYSFLRALYSTPIDQLAAQQRGAIRRRLSEYLQGRGETETR